MEADQQRYWRIAVREREGWVWETEAIPDDEQKAQDMEFSRVMNHWHPEYVRQLRGDEEDICTDKPPQDLDDPFYEYYSDEEDDEEEEEEEE